MCVCVGGCANDDSFAGIHTYIHTYVYTANDSLQAAQVDVNMYGSGTGTDEGNGWLYLWSKHPRYRLEETITDEMKRKLGLDPDAPKVTVQKGAMGSKEKFRKFWEKNRNKL
eukprot:GHVU01108740.1.p2 GENE.GHVU01108740.1~~GHVU01108740.1.p2  ORF type:complete len:112 (+),score=16.12 GHVU01108740.1:673-1008(+)